MASLSDTLRRQLERAVIAARDVAEAGVRAALERLAVRRPQPFSEMAPAERELRVQLRAHARQLGDPSKENGEQEIEHLVPECAYEHWHRMLFARFLAENRLLIHPEHGVPVTLPECEELAAQAGEEDGWALAGRFAARMLPAIFRPGDPVLSVRLAPEHRQALEKLLAGLPVEIFTADDSLGWIYQFWQTRRKDAVNASGKKIGADELPAVTQLFTEPYMVKFLLHNTLGAWWAAKLLAERPDLAATAKSEDDLRSECVLPGCAWTYLRFVRSEGSGVWRVASGTFETWPHHAAEITVLDPCCGSGHFLVEAFRILVAIRVAAEGLSAREGCDAVLRDNIFGLEIDERCTQIAAFNLALAAWTYPDAGGYRPLPEPHIACSGLSVGAKEEGWLKLAGKTERLREGMRRLYRLFQEAPTLGSLIDPRREFEAEPGELEFDKGKFDELRPLLGQALEGEAVKHDAQATEAAITAQGLAKAAKLLAGSYTLVTTNVPYLGRGKQDDTLKAHLEKRYREGKSDLATAFMLRCLDFCDSGCSIALVTPQNWLFLPAYTRTRRRLLRESQMDVVVRLGANAFRDMNFWAATTALTIITNSSTHAGHSVFGLDASASKEHPYKENVLQSGGADTTLIFDQASQLLNPDARISMEAPAVHPHLASIALTPQGTKTGDDGRLRRNWWEVPVSGDRWRFLHGAPDTTRLVDGMSYAVDFERGESAFARPQGQAAWGKLGAVVKLMGGVTASRYFGEIFDSNVTAVVPNRESHLPAVWAFVESPHFEECLRAIEQAVKVNNATVGKVPFDLGHWQRVAAEKYPNGLPEPESDDPTQWLFHGRPEAAAEPLQVAVARVVGYRWPPEFDGKMRLSRRARGLVQRCDELLSSAAADGIVCIPPVLGEQPAADQLQRLLTRSFGAVWTPANLSALLDQEGSAGKTLEDWLRDGFFEQHCHLFHERPFVWHIWDGRRRDGFAALVNYHKLNRKLLERLAYTVLGDWIGRQRQGAKAGERGADERLAAAEVLQKKLALILEGEPPHDIFVRWKPIEQQPIGWEPDLNDGVRMNIRPFVEAGVLRKDPRISWNKDRGTEPESPCPLEQFPWFWNGKRFTGERVNDVHLTNAEKRAARERAAKEQSTGR
jgi:hypothetical protein